MKPDRADRPYPDVAEFTAHVASLHGLRSIVDVGLSWSPELGIVYPELRVTGFVAPGLTGRDSPHYAFGRPLVLSDRSVTRRLSVSKITSGAILVTGPHERLCGDEGVLRRLSSPVRAAALVVVASDDPEPVLALLASMGLQPEFVGRTRANTEDDARSGHLIVVDRELALTRPEATQPPDNFRVVAIMAAYNEEDVIGPAIEKLVGDGVGVYVMDNWSTDRTAEIVRGFDGKGLVGMERFPDAPSDRFALRALVTRVAVIAAGLEADWCIHHDADERRCGPWPATGLREALWLVDRAGYSAVDHTVINYRPIDNEFQPGGDFERHMRHFEFGQTSDLLLQIKAWKNVGPVDLASWAGHQAAFAGRRVFPYKFLLKHYPVRSQSHGERKVFRDRVARWDPVERAWGWHNHYDDIAPMQSFVRNPSDLIEDRGTETRTRYLPEMLTGAGLATRNLPGWALGGRARRSLYLRSRPLVRTRCYRLLRRLVLAPRGLVRRLRRAQAGAR